ncbi:MAG: ankyrin repeat domain-containing protein [Phycisphaerae bacterium]|nr:ankyrin repeat domain-containing protein [Phycisphaerae bacterium]
MIPTLCITIVLSAAAWFDPPPAPGAEDAAKPAAQEAKQPAATAQGRDRFEIHAAAQTGDAERVMKLLAERPTLLHLKNAAGRMPIHVAATASDPSALGVLLEHGAAVNGRDHQGDTPLHLAVRANIVATVDLLLQAGAGVDRKNARGETPLHALVTGEALDSDAPPAQRAIASLLARAGADLRATDRMGLSPLHHAAWHGHAELVELLAPLREGAAAPRGPGAAGESPRDDAADGGSAASRPAKGEPAPSGSGDGGSGNGAAVRGADGSSAADAVRQYDVDLRDLSDCTPLHYAALAGKLPIMDWLIAHGAAVDATDNTGGTPLFSAVHRCRREAVERLLAAGANVHHRDRRGRTALHALAADTPAEPELDALAASAAEALLRGGAEVNARDAGGATPLKLTRQSRREQVADVLKRNGGTE